MIARSLYLLRLSSIFQLHGISAFKKTLSTASTMTVNADLNYVHPDSTELHINRLPNGDSDDSHLPLVPKTYEIIDARGMNVSLHKNGFKLIESPMNEQASIDFLNTSDVATRYYPICEDLLAKHLGRNVLVRAFDHNVRIPDGAIQDRTLVGSGGAKAQMPLPLVHADYTLVSGPARIEALAQPPKTNDVLRDKLGNTPLLDPQLVGQALSGKKRYALINVWRSIDPDNPVESMPLGCCDAGTVTKDEFRTLKIHYTDRVGENYLLVPSNDHRWMFFPEMNMNEVLLIKQWDSMGDIARGKSKDELVSTFSVHSAFALPGENKKPRKSVEVRCVCIWEEE